MACQNITSSLLIAAALALPACDKGDEAKAEAGAAAATGAAPAATGKAEPKAEADEPAKVDEALMAELKAIGTNCEVNVTNVTVTKCKADETSNLRKAFRARDRAAALDTFSAALIGSDEVLKTVAANMSDRVFNKFDAGTKIGKGAAKRYIAAVGRLDKYHASQAVRTAVHAANLAGATDELYTMIDGHSYTRLPPTAYRNLMTRGRLAALPKLKELGASDDMKLQAAALSAPRRMSKPTDVEKNEVCAWTDGFIDSSETYVYEEAGHDAIWCGGASIDLALTRGEKRLAEGSFDRTDYLIFRNVCFKGAFGLGRAGSEAQCARTYKLLQAAADDEKLDGRARGLALFGIYYQRRDAETLALMKTYAKSDVPEIKKRAEEAIESLRKHYKIE